MMFTNTNTHHTRFHTHTHSAHFKNGLIKRNLKLQRIWAEASEDADKKWPRIFECENIPFSVIK